MKKRLVRLVVVAVLIVITAGIAVWLSFDSLVKTGVEAAGPKIAQVSVKLGSANISPFSGRGRLSEVFVGNPAGFKSESAIQAGEVSVRLKPASVLADKIVLDEIAMVAPEITFEGSLKGSNLSKIVDNIKAFSDGLAAGQAKEQPTTEKKLQVNRFVITNGKINVGLKELGGKTATLALPNIELKDLGTGTEGITGADLAQRITKALLENVSGVVSANLAELTKGVAQGLTENFPDSAKDLGEKAADKVKGLFKKKD